VITNFFDLATNSLREKALKIINAGYEAINISKVTKERIFLEGNKLKILDKEYNLKDYKRIYLTAFGKGSSDFAFSVAKILGGHLTGGIVLDVRKPNISVWETIPEELNFYEGTHPLPSLKNVEAVKKIVKMLNGLRRDDLVLTLITGGGSSLLCGSEEELQESIMVTKMLTKSGAPINELNTVRKHLSEVKGGKLAEIVYPAKMISIIACDVCAGKETMDLSMVASGPTIKDKTSIEDAKEIILKYGLNPLNFNLRETPKDEMIFERTENILFVSNEDALMGMVKKSLKLRLKPKIFSLNIEGEAKDSLKEMIDSVNPGEVLIAGGETTVTINGEGGKGGRNQEVVLGALKYLEENKDFDDSLLVSSIASDGRDNGEAGGAIGDLKILQKGEVANLNFKKYLKDHDEFNFFKETGGLVYAEPNSFNVADFMLVLKSE